MPSHQDIEIIDFIVQKHIQSGELNAQNNSILHFAAANGDRALVNQLIEAGSLVDLLDEEGRTPLITAAMHGNKQTCLFLLGCDAATHLVDRYGMTAQAYAEERNYQEIAAVILAHEERQLMQTYLGSHGYNINARSLGVQRL
jgi:ankyrin repeat protein